MQFFVHLMLINYLYLMLVLDPLYSINLMRLNLQRWLLHLLKSFQHNKSQTMSH